MKNLTTIIGAIVIASFFLANCGQNDKQKELSLKEKELQLKEDSIDISINKVTSSEKEKKIEDNVSSKKEEKIVDDGTSQKDIQNQCVILNKWLEEAVGGDFAIDVKMLKKANFHSIDNYKNKAPSSLGIAYGLPKDGLKPEIKTTNKSIEMEFTDRDYNYERLHILEDKFVYSYHAGMGDNGGSFVYDLITHKKKDYPYTFLGVKNNIGEISRGGYDDEGRYWQRGKLNLTTGEINWEAKEH